MHSMTGYGRGEASGKGTKITAEIQSVNKRQTEILVSLPSALTMMESEIRTKIDRSLHRGRVVVTISASGAAGGSLPIIDSELATRYLAQFKQLQRELSLPGDLTIDLILRSPGVISANAPGAVDSSVRSTVEAALDLAIAQLLQMRAKEGSTLKKELLSRIRSIRQALSKVRKLQPRSAKRYRELLMERVRKIGLEIDVDDVRLT
ncbi:MAG: YicC family protein, partial [Verrucomicrobia bacterium]|nr:YicC family protein [Verrucomicrobiota bacterium]